jgi:acetyl-CoA synthetase
MVTFIRQTSDNSVAEIMDSEDPLFILYTSGSTGKPKEWYILPQGIWFILLIHLKCLQLRKRHLLVYGRYRWITGSFLFFIRSIEWSDNSDFEGVPSYPDFSRFGLSKT